MQEQLDRPLGGRRGRLPLRGARHRLPGLHDAPDTLFGATFFVMAPEHPDVLKLNDSPEVREYIARAARESAEERGAEDKEKTGVPLGHTVTNPVNGEQIPMFVADYVLMEYGTGAIMAVPAHDERDFEFAQKFGLEIRRVIECGDLPCTDDGPMVNSGRFDGMHNREAFDAIVEWLESEGKGKPAINYRLRDWLLSRQRYWGCPIPVVHCDKCGIVPVPDDQLPVELPDVEDYAPKGKSPLAAAEDWVNTTCPKCGARRAARDRHDGHLRRLVLVLPALLRRAQRRGAVGPRDRRRLDAGRPVHRRRRARDPAPDVRALLHEGARRPRLPRLPGAVRAPLHAGDGHARRREDVQVEGQHRQPGRLRRALRRRRHARLHPLRRPPGRGRRLVRPGDHRHRALPGAALPRGRRGAGRRTPAASRPRSCARRTGRSTRSRATSASASPPTPRSPP